MNDKEKHIVHISALTKVSNWLTVLSIIEFGFNFSKQPSWDSIRLSYMVGKTCNLPTSCPCCCKFDIQHSMSCKKSGFICIRHNDLQHLTANMLSEACQDTKTETKLTTLCGEELQDRTSNNLNKASVEIRTEGFWERGQQAFYDL